MNSPLSRARWFEPPLAWAVLALAGLAAYANSFGVPFVLDDTVSILENPSIRHLSRIGEVLSPPAASGVGGRPLANLSFALNYALGGTSVTGYHVVNLAIHLATAGVLFALLRRLFATRGLADRLDETSRGPLALAIAALWLLHPLQTEAVTYLSQRTESLMALCYLATLYGSLRFGETGARGWAVAAVAICACGMAVKEVMITAPAMVLLFDRTFLAGNFRDAWRARRWFYGALAGTWLVLVFQLPSVSHRGVTYLSTTWWQYVLIEGEALLHYLRLAAWPSPLVFDYGAASFSPSAVGFACAGAVLALIVATLFALWRWPRVGFVGAWFFVLLAPTSSIVPIAGSPIGEHRMYLPLAGLLAGLALGARAVLHRRTAPALSVLAVVAGFATFQRNADYRTALHLWRDTVAKRPASARAHAALGEALLHEKSFADAIPELRAALRLEPNDAKAENNLATALQELGRLDEAIAHYRASARLEPDSASTHYNLGNALLEQHRPAEAVASLQRALALDPRLAVAHAALGNALVATGRAADAIAPFESALRLDPTLAPAHFMLANLLANTGRFADAIPHYEATLVAYPDVPEAHFNFATVLALTGRTAEAIGHLETALKLKPDFVAARENLAKLRGAATKP